MIMHWNQKEVFMGYSLQAFNEVRVTLVKNKIEYKHRIVNQYQGARRGRTGTFGENMNLANTYYIYVHKKDYDNACEVLQNQT